MRELVEKADFRHTKGLVGEHFLNVPHVFVSVGGSATHMEEARPCLEEAASCL